ADTHATQVMSDMPAASDATAALPVTPTDAPSQLSAQSDGLTAGSLPEDDVDFESEDGYDDEKKRSPWFWPIIGIIILAALTGIGLWVASLGSDEEPEPEPTETVATVSVDAEDYVGRDVEEVSAELEELGFTVNAVERDGTETYGTVLSLNPTGEVEEGADRKSTRLNSSHDSIS